MLDVGVSADERSRWPDVYTHAHSAGLFSGTYADTNAGEYWAELTQAWFHASDPANTGVSDGADILAKDPDAYAFLWSVYGPPAD